VSFRVYFPLVFAICDREDEFVRAENASLGFARTAGATRDVWPRGQGKMPVY
jgi:hypothetical protein